MKNGNNIDNAINNNKNNSLRVDRAPPLRAAWRMRACVARYSQHAVADTTQ